MSKEILNGSPTIVVINSEDPSLNENISPDVHEQYIVPLLRSSLGLSKYFPS